MSLVVGKCRDSGQETKESHKVYLETFTEMKQTRNGFFRHPSRTIFYFDSFQDIVDMSWGGQWDVVLEWFGKINHAACSISSIRPMLPSGDIERMTPFA